MTIPVRLATLSDGAGIRALFGRVFGREMSEAEWLWKYPGNPDGWLSTVAQLDGKIVGHFGGWPMSALIGGRATTLYSHTDVATDPCVRHFGGRQFVLKAMAEALFKELRPRGVAFGFGFPSDRHLLLGSRYIGYRGNFPVREIRFDLSRFDSDTCERTVSRSAGAEFDALWESARGEISQACVVRDRRRANWRFAERPDREYVMVTSGSAASPAGWAVLSIKGVEALAVDYLSPAPAASSFPRLFSAAAAEAASRGAAGLTFWIPPGGPCRTFFDDAIGNLELPFATREAGYSFATEVFDEDAARHFVRHAHFTPALYDDR